MILILTILAVLFLAFSNGANDNFKGVATLFGSKTTNYRLALGWATITTFAGSIVAIFLAEKLLSSFSGKGLIPYEVISLPSFPVAVALSAAFTVFTAAKFGFPISTTHALTGSLIGVGLVASGDVNFSKLIGTFFIPLILSPLISVVLAMSIYPLFKFIRIRMNIKRESCLCVGSQVISVVPLSVPVGSGQGVLNYTIDNLPEMSIATNVVCEERYHGNFFGINAKTTLDSLHFLSSGAVSFARGLNDTPKIAAILLISGTMDPVISISLIGIFMMLGGLLYSKKIANTMSFEITSLNAGQGFTANFVTSIVVIFASKLGMPVSTTHVSCGTLFGIGAITKNAKWHGIFKIFMSWVITLPVAVLLGCLFFLILKGFNL